MSILEKSSHSRGNLKMVPESIIGAVSRRKPRMMVPYISELELNGFDEDTIMKLKEYKNSEEAKATEYLENEDYVNARNIYLSLREMDKVKECDNLIMAKNYETALNFEKAAELYELGNKWELARRVRLKQKEASEKKVVKNITQNIHISDSVLNNTDITVSESLDDDEEKTGGHLSDKTC